MNWTTKLFTFGRGVIETSRAAAGAVSTGIVVLAAPRKRSRNMTQALGFFVLATIACALASAILWFAVTVRDYYWSSPAPVLGEVKLFGDDAKAKAAEIALPSLIVAQLHHQRNQLNEALVILKSLADEEKQQLEPEAHDYLSPRIVPILNQPLNVELKISGVDYGALFKAFESWRVNKEVLSLAVTSEADAAAGKDRISIYGHRTGALPYSVATVAARSSLDGISEAAASAIITQAIGEVEPAFAALNASEAADLLSRLKEYALLERRQRFMMQRHTKDFEPLAREIGAIAKKYPLWENLQRTALRLAFAVSNQSGVLDFATNLKAAVELRRSKITDQNERAKLTGTIERADAYIKRATQAITAAAATASSGSATISSTASKERELVICGPARDKLLVEGYRPLLDQIGLNEPRSAKGVKIGIVGPLPPHWVARQISSNISADSIQGSDDQIATYVAGLVTIVCQVAPEATFVFAKTGQSAKSLINLSDYLAQINNLIEERVDILLYTFSSSSDVEQASSVLRAVFERSASRNVVVVTPAGNDGGKKGALYRLENQQGLRLAATDAAGRAASFSMQDSETLWAPGVDLLVPSETKTLVKGAGTSYSAAVGAGAAAVLRSRHPSATPAQLREALLATARPVDGGDIRVINIKAASDRLAANWPPGK